MRAIQMTQTGGPQVLQLVEVPDPTPLAGTVLIKVEAAAVNFADVLRRRGDPYPVPMTFPFIPGGEVAGTVVGLGEGVEGPAIGTAVFAIAGDGSGGYAQYALAAAQAVIPIPPGVDVDTAAGIIIAGGAAAVMLTEVARLAAGETVFIPAAAGGAGGVAVQIAKTLGAGTVIGGASTAQKRQTALDLGADHVVDYTREGWISQVREATSGTGVEVALEMTGGSRLADTLRVLGPFGRLVVYGAVSGVPGRVPDDILDAMLYDPAPNQSLHGFNLGPWFTHRPHAAFGAIARLIDWVASGQVRIPVGHTLPLADAAEAHRLIETGLSHGKIILHP